MTHRRTVPGAWRIPRRRFLRGAGAAVSLPLLDAMAPLRAGAAPGRPPVRMACLFFPNGAWMDSWHPKTAGFDYELSYALEPLAGLKKDIVVFSGLDKAASRQGDGHYAKTANFLTGLPITKTTGKDISVGGPSLDQIIASRSGHLTPLPSLELGIDPVISGVDSNVGFTRLYGSYISWRSAGVPMAREINPRFVYERLFGMQNAGGVEERRRRELADNSSLLDLVLDDAKDLRGRLGRDDQFKLDEYMDSVRAVERQIEFVSGEDPRDWHPEETAEFPEAPEPGVPSDYRRHVRLMLDLMALALQTDSTRVITFMFANSVSGRSFSFVEGVSNGYHQVSHHENQEANIDQYRRINRWHAGQYAYLLEKLRGVREGEGTLLDNCMILMGSGISDGNSHSPNNLPMVLGGRGGGRIATGQHIASPKNTPLCNLYLSMLDCMGAPAEKFGDSTGPIHGLVV